MKTNLIREKFLSYFEKNGHKRVESSSLIPKGDATLLFTNAGMVQFKDVFLGNEKKNYKTATTSQKCVRAGGKHNDLENVGYTSRHHTFFEMLGNFSFGEYFKERAITLAWDFLTEELKLPGERMLVTVYKDDLEAYDIWAKKINLPKSKIIKIGDKLNGEKFQSDNFWQMGDSGPCGPCSEIFWDHGEDIFGGPPGSKNENGDRFIEIWNLVFMQFNRDEKGIMHELPRPSVDTGMGLERMAAVLQKVHSNYETDVFVNLIQEASRILNCENTNSNSLKVISDHIRSCCFLILDGVIPGNEGRGYVLRRIIRRAIRHGYKLGQKKPFFYKLTDNLVSLMGKPYPALYNSASKIKKILESEELKFFETIENGMSILNKAMMREDKVLGGEIIFKLYDTFGFPVDLTADIARERRFQLDLSGFEEEMKAQRERARENSNFNNQSILNFDGPHTIFKGYELLSSEAKVISIIKNESFVESLSKNEEGIIILDQTTFYAESGGQIGDKGEINGINSPFSIFEVSDTKKLKSNFFGHFGKVSVGNLKIGDPVKTLVDENFRQALMRNHSATHLLHAALKNLIGSHVQQRGSLVETKKLRFDFSHNCPLDNKDINRVEMLVNSKIRENIKLDYKIMNYDKAVKNGAVAIFDEKYGDEVRVIEMSGFSKELCGGTHVSSLGEIGLFKIISESGVSSGVRRIEAITADIAVSFLLEQDSLIKRMSEKLNSSPNELHLKLDNMMNNVKNLEKEISKLKSKLSVNYSSELIKKAIKYSAAEIIISNIENVDVKNLREISDQIKVKVKNLIMILTCQNSDKISIVSCVSKEISHKIHAGELIKFFSKFLNGKGGGSSTLAQGGGQDLTKLNLATEKTKEWILKKLN